MIELCDRSLLNKVSVDATFMHSCSQKREEDKHADEVLHAAHLKQVRAIQMPLNSPHVINNVCLQFSPIMPSDYRLLHLHLLLAHLTACVSVGASVSRRVLSMTNASCYVTTRGFLYSSILHQVLLSYQQNDRITMTRVSLSTCNLPWQQRALKVY